MGKKSITKSAPIEKNASGDELKLVSQQLREARELKKLSIDDVASQLRISKFRIRQLEDDDAPLMCDVYTRGFIRNYSEFLGLTSDPLLSQHERLCSLKKDDTPTADVFQMTKSSSPNWTSVAFSGVLALTVMGAIIYTYQNHYDLPASTLEASVLAGNTHQWLRSTEPVWVEVKTSKGDQLSNHIMEANESYALPDNEDVMISTDNLGALQLVSSESDAKVLGIPGERVYHYKIPCQENSEAE